MQIQHLSALLPPTPGADFPHQLRHLLPLALRVPLAKALSAALGAEDPHRLKRPQKSGSLVRDFAPGDSLAHLSKVHMLKWDKLAVEWDQQWGQTRAVLCVHHYANSLFRAASTDSKSRAAQVAAALVYQAHRHQQQRCDLLVCKEPNFPLFIQQHSAQLRRTQFLYFFTDLFFNPQSAEASGSDMLQVLRNFKRQKRQVWVIRDHQETSEGQTQSTTLEPFLKPSSENGLYQSGPHYTQALRRQWEHFSGGCAQQGIYAAQVHPFTPVQEVFTLLRPWKN